MGKIVEIKNGLVGNPDKAFRAPINLSIEEGEKIAIVGDNASGKSRLAEVLSYSLQLSGDSIQYHFQQGMISDNVRYIAFKDSYGPADNNYFLQQRWEQCFIDEEATPTVKKSLGSAFESSPIKDTLLDIFNLEPFMDKFIISLSSGELRKFRFAKALMRMPKLLIVDNPFIGLDANTRDEVTALLKTLSERIGMTLVLVLTKPEMMPDFITHVIPVHDLIVDPKIPVSQYKINKVTSKMDNNLLKMVKDYPMKEPDNFYPQDCNAEIVRCNSVSIKYGNRTILKDLNWTIKEGERWLLTGKNGSGKSTLLSLICADNPQSYACNIELFSHKRGTGESIWEIKKHIGYVSPELQRSYQKDITAVRIVSSGFFDTLGLFKSPTDEQKKRSLYWMKIFGIEDLAERSYLKLSDGEQRLCLLARAFVKDPELIVLDEPFHGLDNRHCDEVMSIIDAFMKRPHKTLIFVSHYKNEVPSCVTHKMELIRNL